MATTNKRKSNKTVQSDLNTIDSSIMVNPEVVNEMLVIEDVVIEQPVIEEVVVVIEQPIETELVIEEVVVVDQPAITIEQLMLIVSQQAKEIEDMKNQQVKQIVPTNNGMLNGNGDKKADMGRNIWNDEQSKNPGQCPVRSVTIKRLIHEAGLTEKGAPTYYQNMKKKAGYVQSK